MDIELPKSLIVLHGHDASCLPPLDAVLATGHGILMLHTGSDETDLYSDFGTRCQCLRLAENSSMGDILRIGAEQAARGGYTCIVTLGDPASDMPADILFLLEATKSLEMPALLLGVRRLDKKESPWLSRMGKAVATFLVRLECGLELPDVQSGLRVYPVRELLAQQLIHRRYGCETEVIVKFVWSGIPVIPVSVPESCPQPPPLPASPFRKIIHIFRFLALHGYLVGRRLLPWPYKRLKKEEPLPEKIRETLSHNPFKVLGRICREHTSPLWLAMAVWLGIFMGALPLLAVHTIAIIYVAHRLHINKVAAVAASQFCMPPVMPVLCIQTGYYLRHGEWLVDFSWQPWLLGIHERLWEWFLGSLLLGPLFGVIGALVMYWMASRLQSRAAK